MAIHLLQTDVHFVSFRSESDGGGSNDDCMHVQRLQCGRAVCSLISRPALCCFFTILEVLESWLGNETRRIGKTDSLIVHVGRKWTAVLGVIKTYSPHYERNKVSAFESLVLCSDVQVCRRWLQLCSLPELWRAHCSELGEKEGVGDLANAVEATSLASGGGRDGEKVGKEGEVVIDWKRAYRNLSRVTARIKTLVVQAGVCVCVCVWGGGS